MSDVVRFTCPACGQKYRAPTRLAGRHRTCVRCGTPYDIPAQEVAALREPQHLAVGAPAQAAGDESLTRIPPAGPISQFAAALSESHAEAKAQAAAISESDADTNADTAPLAEDHADTHVETAPLPESHAEAPPENRAETLPTIMADAEVKAVARQFAAVPEPPAPERHPCPFCGEDILRSALKCKHCGEFLNGSSRPAEAPPVHEPDSRAIAEALAKAELSAADARARAQRAAADACAKADEVAAVARRNEERIAAINRQIEMQAESDYRQVLLRAADSLSAAEKSAVSQCRFCSDVYHAVERMGIDPVAAMSGSQHRGNGHDPAARDTLAVITHVMDLIVNPPPRFRRAYEKTVEAFAAYGQMDELSRTPPTDMVAREASLADLHTRFAASMADMRGLLRSSGA